MNTISWRRVKESTRATHLRWLLAIRAMPIDLRQAPLGTALVCLVLRKGVRRWRAFSSFAGAMAQVASALRHLPLYSNAAAPIDIKQDPVFLDAYRRALHVAKVAKRHGPAETLVHDDYLSVLKLLPDPEARLLAELLWLTTARPNDLRQVHGADVQIIDSEGTADPHLIITFRYGKGAAFWGPFSVRVAVPAETISRLRAHMLTRRGQGLFSTGTVSAVGAALRTVVPGMSVRAIRRGALQHLAACGCTEAELMLLSGHRAQATLLRYLGWGVFSAAARSAAASRAAKNPNVKPTTEDSKKSKKRTRNDTDTDEDSDSDIEGGAAPAAWHPPLRLPVTKKANTEAPKMGVWATGPTHPATAVADC